MVKTISTEFGQPLLFAYPSTSSVQVLQTYLPLPLSRTIIIVNVEAVIKAIDTTSTIDDVDACIYIQACAAKHALVPVLHDGSVSSTARKAFGGETIPLTNWGCKPHSPYQCPNGRYGNGQIKFWTKFYWNKLMHHRTLHKYFEGGYDRILSHSVCTLSRTAVKVGHCWLVLPQKILFSARLTILKQLPWGELAQIPLWHLHKKWASKSCWNWWRLYFFLSDTGLISALLYSSLMKETPKKWTRAVPPPDGNDDAEEERNFFKFVTKDLTYQCKSGYDVQNPQKFFCFSLTWLST